MAVTEAELLATIERHRRELRLHAYRMLGSSHDCDDVLQESSLRAWRARHSLDDPTRARSWLYRIVTNVCLDELARRRARPEDAVDGEIEAGLEPCPDTWLAGQERVALAFVAALQHLTPTQRAVLLLRDVVELSAKETAEALEMGVEAANSSLFRARTRLAERPAAVARATVDAELLRRYVRAWTEGDFDGFVAVLHADVRTTMPPEPTQVVGIEPHFAFYRPMFDALADGTSAVTLVTTGANGQPAWAFYRRAPGDTIFRFRAIHVVALREGAIAHIDHFLVPALARVFALPDALP